MIFPLRSTKILSGPLTMISEMDPSSIYGWRISISHRSDRNSLSIRAALSRKLQDADLSCENTYSSMIPMAFSSVISSTDSVSKSLISRMYCLTSFFVYFDIASINFLSRAS